MKSYEIFIYLIGTTAMVSSAFGLIVWGIINERRDRACEEPPNSSRSMITSRRTAAVPVPRCGVLIEHFDLIAHTEGKSLDSRDNGNRPDFFAAQWVAGEPRQVFRFLAALSNHAGLLDRRVEIATPGARSTELRLRGPFGARRSVRTELTDLVPSRRVAGRAFAGRGTEATIEWSIQPAPAPRDGVLQSWVEVAATVRRAGLLDRALLALGGRGWLERRFERAARTLAERFAWADRGLLGQALGSEASS